MFSSPCWKVYLEKRSNLHAGTNIAKNMHVSISQVKYFHSFWPWSEIGVTRQNVKACRNIPRCCISHSLLEIFFNTDHLWNLWIIIFQTHKQRYRHILRGLLGQPIALIRKSLTLFRLHKVDGVENLRKIYASCLSLNYLPLHIWKSGRYVWN